MSAILYWKLNGNYEECKQILKDTPKEELEQFILNNLYNDFLWNMYYPLTQDSPSAAYPLFIDFAGGRIPITFMKNTKGEKFVSFSAKFESQTRYATKEEFIKIMSLIGEAIQITRQPVDFKQRRKLSDEKTEELREYMNSLEF